MQTLWKTIWEFLKVLNVKLSCDAAIPLLRDPGEMKTYVHSKTCMRNEHNIVSQLHFNKINLKKNLYVNVQNTIIYSSQNIETTETSVIW